MIDCTRRLVLIIMAQRLFPWLCPNQRMWKESFFAHSYSGFDILQWLIRSYYGQTDSWLALAYIDYMAFQMKQRAPNELAWYHGCIWVDFLSRVFFHPTVLRISRSPLELTSLRTLRLSLKGNSLYRALCFVVSRRRLLPLFPGLANLLLGSNYTRSFRAKHGFSSLVTYFNTPLLL